MPDPSPNPTPDPAPAPAPNADMAQLLWQFTLEAVKLRFGAAAEQSLEQYGPVIARVLLQVADRLHIHFPWMVGASGVRAEHLIQSSHDNFSAEIDQVIRNHRIAPD